MSIQTRYGISKRKIVPVIYGGRDSSTILTTFGMDAARNTSYTNFR